MWSVRAGPIGRPLADEQQRMLPVVQLDLEELVFLMWQLDAQQIAPARGGQVLFYPDLPASHWTAFSRPGCVQQLRCGPLRSCDLHRGHLEDEVGGAQNLSGGVSLSIVSRGPQDEGELGASGVRVVSVGPLPGVLFGVKGEVSGEKEDVGTSFTALAHPAARQSDWKGRSVGQNRRVQLRGAIDQGTHGTGVDMMLQISREGKKNIRH